MADEPISLVCPKCNELVLLLIECRDALPTISLASARLHGVRLDLDKRIETALEPWEIKEETKCLTN